MELSLSKIVDDSAQRWAYATPAGRRESSGEDGAARSGYGNRDGKEWNAEDDDSSVVVGAREQEGGGVLQSCVCGGGSVSDRRSKRERGGAALGGRRGILGCRRIAAA